jgi:hypothetical protein
MADKNAIRRNFLTGILPDSGALQEMDCNIRPRVAHYVMKCDRSTKMGGAVGSAPPMLIPPGGERVQTIVSSLSPADD